jgi:hypothetical protein
MLLKWQKYAGSRGERASAAAGKWPV